jgi:hypothetical protein
VLQLFNMHTVLHVECMLLLAVHVDANNCMMTGDLTGQPDSWLYQDCCFCQVKSCFFSLAAVM